MDIRKTVAAIALGGNDIGCLVNHCLEHRVVNATTIEVNRDLCCLGSFDK